MRLFRAEPAINGAEQEASGDGKDVVVRRNNIWMSETVCLACVHVCVYLFSFLFLVIVAVYLPPSLPM